MNKELVQSIAFTKKSSYRLKILNLVNKNKLLTPKEISKKIGIRLSHTSMSLKGLKENNLVYCVNEEAKKGRLYDITQLGKETIEYIKKND